MLGRLRLPTGVLAITADEHRSQLRNREAALERLGKILTESMVRPRRRRATKPSAASKQRRLDQKKVRSEVKKQRRPQNDD
jgi:ribosome-associated protein